MKEGWEYRKFDDALEKVKYTRKLQTNEFLPEGTFPIISQEEEFISGYWNNKEDLFKVNKPVVIFGDHSRVLKYIDFDFVLGADGVKILEPIDTINAKFLYHFLKWFNVPNMGYSRHYKFLKEINLPIPPLKEQIHIVEELDLLSGIIEKEKAQLEELDKLAQSIFYDMFGDPISNNKYGFVSLGELIENLKYGTSTPPTFSKTGYKFIRATNIKQGGIIEDNMMFIDELEASRLSKCKLTDRDLVIVRSGVNAGDVCRIGKQYAGQYAGYDIIITANIELANTFFLNSILNNRSYIDLVIKPLTRRAAQPHLNAQQVRSMPILNPPLSLQQEFAEKIEAIEAMKAKVRQSLKEAETLFNSRMDYYFN